MAKPMLGNRKKESQSTNSLHKRKSTHAFAVRMANVNQYIYGKETAALSTNLFCYTIQTIIYSTYK